MNKLQKIIAISLGLIALAGAAYSGVCYFATAESVQIVAQRLDIKILTDLRYDLQKRIWEIEDRYGTYPPQEVLQQLRELKLQLEDIERQLEEVRMDEL